MRNLVLVLFVLVTSCVHNGPGPVTPIEKFGHCSSDAIRQTSEGILGEVTTALTGGDYEASIARLVGTYTAAEVGCAVDLVIDLFSKRAAHSDDTQVHVVLAHAQDWRKEHP